MIIVNFSTKEYARGQQRLSNSLNGYKKLMLNDYVSIGSPTHKESPYEFKVHAIEKAFEFDDIVLWADSSLWRVGDISKIEKIIQKDGYFMEEAGHYCIDWCNDHCRKMLNYNAMGDEYHYTMFSAGLIGLDRNNPTASLWFEQWKEAAGLGCFKGNWKDHRHDMTAGSILAQRLGMRYQRGGSHLSYVGPGYSEPEKDTVFLLQGI
jgi:hypothetical protein